MAQQHDLFDDIIDISKGLSALKNPSGGGHRRPMGTATGEAPHWNPPTTRERLARELHPLPFVCNQREELLVHPLHVTSALWTRSTSRSTRIDIADTCRGLRGGMPHEAFHLSKFRLAVWR